jgi:hypothetical protein
MGNGMPGSGHSFVTALMKGVVMGQATVDLPDPLNPPTASAASTDDLLAQLAGQEIDRMLAESESDSGHISAAPRSNAHLDPILPAAPAAPIEKSTGEQLNEFLGDLSATDPEEKVSVADFAAGKVVARPKSSSDGLDEDDLLAAERGALQTGRDPLDDRQGEGAGPAPFYIQALEWLNSPLDSCPDHIRELVGKIAILTMVNAISVLVYVLFFRHHG